jgi:hypothetical protein
MRMVPRTPLLNNTQLNQQKQSKRSAMEPPLLRLGLLGFGRAKANLAAARVMAVKSQRARWAVAAFEDADVLLVDSASVTVDENRGLLIRNPDAPDSPLTIYPHQTSRPVAFTQPLPAYIDVVLGVSLDDAYDCAQALNTFTDLLGTLCNHFALGEQIANRQSSLINNTYHLHFEGRLVAMVDVAQWQVSLAPDTRAFELSLASWRHRPNESQRFPPNFEALSLERLMWVYASRAQQPRLPEAYLSSRIYLRRVPVLPQSWLHEDHLNLIGHLSQQPSRMAGLVQHTRLPFKRLSACLAALYYTGTVTTDVRQIVAGDKRIPSAFGSLDTSEPFSHSDQERASGQSVFDTHSFATSNMTA